MPPVGSPAWSCRRPSRRPWRRPHRHRCCRRPRSWCRPRRRRPHRRPRCRCRSGRPPGRRRGAAGSRRRRRALQGRVPAPGRSRARRDLRRERRRRGDGCHSQRRGCARVTALPPRLVWLSAVPGPGWATRDGPGRGEQGPGTTQARPRSSVGPGSSVELRGFEPLTFSLRMALPQPSASAARLKWQPCNGRNGTCCAAGVRRGHLTTARGPIRSPLPRSSTNGAAARALDHLIRSQTRLVR